MFPFAEPLDFHLDEAPSLGSPDAAVSVVLFMSARGSNCARVVPFLYSAITNGPLKGKIRLYAKIFPLRSNTFAKEAALAFMAAHRQGRFWEYADLSFRHFTDFTPDSMDLWARELGLDMEQFGADVDDPALLDEIVASKREGLEKGVDATPALFIGGHPYLGDIDPEEIVDVLEEVYQRETGRVYCDWTKP